MKRIVAIMTVMFTLSSIAAVAQYTLTEIHLPDSTWPHKSIINSDGSKCLTTTKDGKVRLWDAWSGALIACSPSDDIYERYIGSFIINDRYYLTTTKDSSKSYSTNIHDARTGKILLTCPSSVDSTDINEQGTRCLSRVGKNGSFELWDIERTRLIGKYDNLNNAHFAQTGDRIVAGFATEGSTVSNSTVLLNAIDGKVMNRYPGTITDRNHWSFEYDSILVIYDATEIRIIALATGALIGVLPTRDRIIDIDRMNGTIYTTDYSSAQIWSFPKIRPLLNLPLNTTLLPVLSPDGKRIISPLDYGHLQLIEVSTGRVIAQLRCDWKPAQIRKYCDDCSAILDDKVAFSPDGTRILISPSCPSVPHMSPMLFDGTTGRLIRRLRGIDEVQFCAGGKNLICHTYSFDEQGHETQGSGYRLVRATDGKRVGNSIPDILFEDGNDGAQTMMTMFDRKLYGWNLVTGSTTPRLLHPVDVKRFDTTDTRILTTDEEGVVRLWDRPTGTLIGILSDNSSADATVFSPNSTIVATHVASSISNKEQWFFHNAATGKLLWVHTQMHRYGRGEFSRGGNDFQIYSWGVSSVYIYHFGSGKRQNPIAPIVPTAVSSPAIFPIVPPVTISPIIPPTDTTKQPVLPPANGSATIPVIK